MERSPRHRIAHDPTGGLLRITRTGVWDSGDVAAYRRDLATALRQAGSRPSFDVLIDITDAPVMPKAVAAEMDEVATLLLDSAARRIAFVSGSALARLQVQRLVGEPSRVRQFATAADAAAWLVED